MTDRYLVAGATGGNGTQSLPWGTLNEARLGSSDGDRWICNGTFVGAALTSGGTTGYATITQQIEIISRTDYSATFAPSVATGCFYMGTTYAKTLTLGDINISGVAAGGVAPNYAIWTQSTAEHQIIINGTKISAVNFYCLNIDATNSLLDLVANDFTATIATGGRQMVRGVSLGATANITIARPVANFAAKNHSGVITDPSTLISLIAAQAGATAVITDFDLSYTNSGTGNYAGIISVFNINNARIQRGRFAVVEIGTASCLGVKIDCNSGTLTANRGRIDSLRGSVDANAGIVLLMGHDAAATGDNRGNYGVIKDCNIIGSTRSKAGNVHGIMQGNQTGGQTLGGSAVSIGIGALQKQTTDSLAAGVTTRDCSNYHHYHKGATRARSTQSKIYINGAEGVAFNATVGDAAQNNSGCYFGGNDISINGAANKIINTAASQDVTFGPNNYWLATGATIANPAATIAGTDYATLALANAASDTAAQTTTGVYTAPDAAGSLVYAPQLGGVVVNV